MQKLTLLASSKHLNSALEQLRSLGVVHIKHLRQPAAQYINSLEHRLADLDKAISLLGDSSAKEQDLDRNEMSSYIQKIINLDSQKQELTARIKELERKRLWFKDWGNVSSPVLAELKKAAVFIKLYLVNKNSLKHIPKEKLVYIINRKKAQLYLAFVGTCQKDSLGFSEIEVPQEDLHSVEKKIHIAASALKVVNEKLAKICDYKDYFLTYKKELLKKLEFGRVRFGMAYDEGICYLQGFCPAESMSKINKAAARQGWAVISQEPDNPQEVPTLIRNPKWIEIIKPVFKFMGALPGYKEYDISFSFLLFFSIFFAMLIGDAGYGLIFLAATFFIRKKFKNISGKPFFLMYVLSSATVIWGAVTGTWFGFEKIAKAPFFNFLVIDRVNSFGSTNQIFMIYLCFLIGAVHLTLAHGIIFCRFINSLIALAQIGWICIIWAVFFVAGSLILGRPLPGFTLILGAVGVALAILFSNPQKNILKGMAVSLAELPLKTINSFSDIVSYLRLFAVGYATVAVATTFNNMALGSGINNILTGLIAALILFLGHSLNIILGLIAVIVHGIRLNMLEFSGHLGMQWSGLEYKPFKE